MGIKIIKSVFLTVRIYNICWDFAFEIKLNLSDIDQQIFWNSQITIMNVWPLQNLFIICPSYVTLLQDPIHVLYIYFVVLYSARKPVFSHESEETGKGGARYGACRHQTCVSGIAGWPERPAGNPAEEDRGGPYASEARLSTLSGLDLCDIRSLCGPK